jgi:hypothetical protein
MLNPARSLETTRLWPAVPNGVQRKPPPDGGPVVVAGHLVPVGTSVQIPTWSRTWAFAFYSSDQKLNAMTVHRDARYFSPNPHMFWPERWTDEGEKLAAARGEPFRLNKTAWMPFNYGALLCSYSVIYVLCAEAASWCAGPGNCIGRSLALKEMRAVLAAIVRRFDIRFADGFDPAMWEPHLKDRFILMPGALPVVMSKRT